MKSEVEYVKKIEFVNRGALEDALKSLKAEREAGNRFAKDLSVDNVLDELLSLYSDLEAGEAVHVTLERESTDWTPSLAFFKVESEDDSVLKLDFVASGY